MRNEEHQPGKVEGIVILRSCTDPVIERHTQAIKRRLLEIERQVRIDLGLDSGKESA